MDAVCVIAAPGAGTDELCRALRTSADLAAHRGVFGPDRVGGIEPQALPVLRQITGVDFAAEQDPALMAFVHQHPATWLDALEAAAGDQDRRVLAFPLFSGELPLEVAEQEVMARTGLRVMLLMRRQIDSFVAWRKAAALAQMGEAGRIGVRLKLNPDDFCRWMDLQEGWYSHWREYLKRRFLPCPVLRYESDIDRQPADAVLRRFAAAAAQVGITLRAPRIGNGAEAPPAMRVRNVAEDVRNWTEFAAEIFRRGLEKRAFGYPI